MKAYHAIHLEYSQGDESSECGRQNISSVQDRNSCCKFLACVESGEDIKRSWIVRCFRDTEEETSEEQTSVVLANGCETTDHSPYGHAG